MANAPITSRQSDALNYVAARDPGGLLRRRASNYLERWCRGQILEFGLTTGLLTINFHPDRPAGRNCTVIESVLRTGCLQNQFESALTNGFALDAKTGVRARRESMLFGGAYDDAPHEERPKYGAVNLFANARGGWPRFGSCHWVLDPSVLSRCTMTVPGSHSTSAWWGRHSDLVGLIAGLPVRRDLTGRHRFRLIDGPAELQVHGDVLLERDVAALAIDPSFTGTVIESASRRISDLFDVQLQWVPPLHSTGTDWKVPPIRQRAHQRVSDALSSGEVIDAAWIGRDLWPDNGPAQSIRDGASRYLWNRLLLTWHPESSPR